MNYFFSYIMLICTKYLSILFFKHKLEILSDQNKTSIFEEDIRLIALLNHTSLYEPVFTGIIPNFFLKRLASHMIIPVAKKTTDRPIVGLFFKYLGPNIIPITRKQDASWENFKTSIKSQSIVVILPEGRMKRLNGFDSNGKKMSIKGGFSEILQEMNEGKMMIVYSGGLHQIQSPGQLIPRLFKTVQANLEVVDIHEYKNSFQLSGRALRMAITKDLQYRLETKCP